MKLTELEPQFLRYKLDGHYVPVHELAQADGISFLCPKCFAANGGKTGTHVVTCWFEGKVPDDTKPCGRWTPAGTHYRNLSFVLGRNERSLQAINDCRFRPFLADGEITWKRPGRT